MPSVNRQDLTSQSKAVNTTFKEVGPHPSLMIWNLESEDNDRAKRHVHDQSIKPLIINLIRVGRGRLV
ncbi:unnamed protein product [Schistosoma mattheei]|uniref:Uncharacterized protein n=1 Tax=Schistosoma mattheei TaxID=31246 RepID=A0A183PA86_9TREM|nr:unnamed protein product [Schistosoma mattheei]